MAGIKVVIWDDEKAKSEIAKRYRQASESRRPLEDTWIYAEQTLYSTTMQGQLRTGATSVTDDYNIGVPGIDDSDLETNVAYVFKNFRFLHAQMSANPPAVAMRPQTSDQDDHRKADAADRISRWALRHYKLQEKQDQQNLGTLGYGTGFVKTVWDSTRGDIIEFDAENGECKLEGDIAISTPFIWNMYIDPDAKAMDELKWVIEKIYMDYNEALGRWPDKEEELKKARITESSGSPSPRGGRTSQLNDKHYNVVELLEYWETGLPTNGYMGRFCITILDGDVIEPCRPSPFRFKRAGAVSRIENDEKLDDEEKMAKVDKLPEQAQLPYSILTDIDVPNMVWGKSAVDYAASIQENLVRLDSARLDNIRAAGTPKLILPENTEIAEDSLSDVAWDVVRITGNQPPYWQSPAQMMPQMDSERQNFITGINDVMGVNESMFGQQSREQAAAAMQYATNQGNMIRRRLFNKYTLNIESIHKNILNLIRKHWSVERTIFVVGKEKALEAIDIKGADIDGGYDIVGEYGTTLSLDPVTRREEILQLQPLFEKAGVPARTSMRMLKLNEVEGLFDELDLAENRQKEVFDEMIADHAYIAPEEQMDHENMIAWALHYFMTEEFQALSPEDQLNLKTHNKARGALAAQEKSGANSAAAPGNQVPAASPGPVPSQPAGPVPPAGGPAASPAPGAT